MIDSLRRASNRALSVFRSRGLDADLDAEILCHIDAAVAENIHRGMEPGEARRFALVRFGGLAQAKQQQRETRGLPALDALRQDIRLSLRMLKRDRAFACIVIFVLALGIGANVAVFSVVNNILLRPLPFRDANRLVWLATNEGKGGLSSQTYTVAAFEEFRKHNNPSRTSPLTRLSSVPSVLGRLFTAEERRRGASAVALLSYVFGSGSLAAIRQSQAARSLSTLRPPKSPDL
ncbi:MAG TPA: permease prefix domain 1-containing protein [Bryobacteraceae bacterium]|nr:permease prefix domain 1-containing protein [Bryobacteraceae bacterium]